MRCALVCPAYPACTMEASGGQKPIRAREILRCVPALMRRSGMSFLNGLPNKQCIFERKCEDERVLVAINADGEDYTAHFDAGCGTAVDLINGEPHDFGGGSVLPAYSAYFWKMER